MKEACSPGGTGWPLFDFSISESTPSASQTLLTTTPTSNLQSPTTNHQPPITKIQTACKTGTAESQTKSSEPHAWFTAYAPFDKPEIAISVLLEEAGQGSDIAGPIVRDILKEYFGREN